ncbi:acetyltransferase [Xylaria intraflava]|nr:acetyltransferase [Xylaria intraflava]
MSGTPFISLLPPGRVYGYKAGVPHDQQSTDVPSVFKDAMSVRETVFVEEQKCPLEHEFDADDPRSCHWVVYASVKTTKEPEQRDPVTNAIIRPRRSEAISMPIGTLRLVPFPHTPHPVDGGRYVGNVLQHSDDHNGVGNGNGAKNGNGKIDHNIHRGGLGDIMTQPPFEDLRRTFPLSYGPDRATEFHDGKEPYVKIGRVAVLPQFRGHQIAVQLWNAARKWLLENPTYFNPSVRELGLERMKVGDSHDIPKWNGLVCVHAQESVVKVYERWGFRVDKGMGKWYEEGIPHVGMFLRLEVNTEPQI